MIIFDLTCPQAHSFEGWFQSQSTYDSQVEQGLVVCPHCGSDEIRRIPSTPHLSAPTSAHAAGKQASPGGGHPAPAGILAAYQQLMEAIVAHCEDVGTDFADEARKIHYMEAPQRSIRGLATNDDYEELRDEGIDIVQLPSIKKH